MSQMSREDMLRELELLPVWQLRVPAPVELKSSISSENAPALQILEEVHQVSEQAVPATVLQQEIATQEVTIIETDKVAPVLNRLQQAPLRLLLSEDAAYAFLLPVSNDDADAPAVETLLQNMLKAMKVNCRTDVIKTGMELFTEQMPKLIICMGELPANTLLDKSFTVTEWRNLQMVNQIHYQAMPVIVTYHPAYLLENMADKAKAWTDLCFAKKIMQTL